MTKEQKWELYSKKYNELSAKIKKAGIDPKLLREVVDAARELHKEDN